MALRKHRWGLYFAVEDFSKPRPQRTIHDGIDISLLKDIRPVSIDSIKLFVTVHGLIADVTCQASFTNTEADHIDGFFLFPVDPEASLYHFEASLCGRKVVAASREKGENHELSLLEELDGEGILLEETASDMFTCHIGVVPSDEQVDVMFQYSIELMISPEGDVPFIFPSFVPREFQARYMDSAIGQSDQLSYSVDEYSFDFYFQAIIAGNYMIRDVLSREVLEIDYLDQSHYNAKLTLSGSYLPNRDFAFTMKYADIESPHILVQKGGSETAFDHVVMTNQCGLFTLFHRLNKTRPKSMKGEFIFCVDRSIGMRGHKMQLARETLLYFIKGLPVGCYFNIISFGGIAQPLFKSSRVYNQYNVMKAIKCQLKMRADMNGQNVLGLLQHVYEQPLIAGHPKQVFIITEGSDANKHECVEYINQRSEFARIFTIGIGEACKRAMITGLARAGSGKPHFLKLNEKPYNTVLDCLKQALQPGLTDLQMEFDTPAGVTCLTIPPMIPPIVFAEEKLQIYILIRGQPEDQTDNDCSVTLSGTLGKDEPYSRTIHFNLAESMVNENLPIHRLALKTEINDLEKSIATALGADDILENEYHIKLASLSGNIASRFTPLVAIDAMTGQEVEGFPIIRVRADEISYGRAHSAAAASVYKSVSRLTLSRPGESPSAFVRGIFERQSGQRAIYSMADSRIHDFDDEVEDGLEMEYTFQRAPPTVADIDSEMALSEIYMGISDKEEWDTFKDSLKHPGGLTKFQHHDGYWMLDKKIAYAFCSTVTEVKNENPLRDDLVWTTVLALNWLKVNFGIRKTEWKESEDWARAWIYQQDLEGYSLDELLELAAGLKHMDGHMLFKPPPRPQREISTIDESEETESFTNQPSEPVTYMKQDSITMIGNDLDDMAEEEYLNDEVHDIKTNAVEISATSKRVASKPTRSEDATRDHPGHLVVSPSQHQDPPSFPAPVMRSGSMAQRHHHTTAQRQESMRRHEGRPGVTMGRYGEVAVPVPSTPTYPKSRPQPSKRSSIPSPSPSNSDGKAFPPSYPLRRSVSGRTQTQQNQNISQSDQPRSHPVDQSETMREYFPQNQPDPSDYETTRPYQYEQASVTHQYQQPEIGHQYQQPEVTRQDQYRQPEANHQYQPEVNQHYQYEHPEVTRGQPAQTRQPEYPSHHNQYEQTPYHNGQSEELMHHRTQSLNQSPPQASPRFPNHQQFEGTSHYSPLQPERAFQPIGATAGSAETEHHYASIHSAPVNSSSPPDSRTESSGRSAPRPNALPLRHTTSTDIKIDESLEELNFEHHDDSKSSMQRSTSMRSSHAPKSASKMSLRSVASTSYAVEPARSQTNSNKSKYNHSNKPTPSNTNKPKRSLTFKQRMKNLKDNLMYAADIKYCRKRNDLTRMNSLRSSIRSGRSPYVNDYDETDELISSKRRPNQRRRRPPPQSSPEEVVRSERPVPGPRSRPVSRAPSVEAVSRPTTPLMARSRPVTPKARSRPPSPDSTSIDPRSRPTTPVFRSGTKAPEASYFRPRTPSAAETPPYSPPTMRSGGADSIPLISPPPQVVRPIPERVVKSTPPRVTPTYPRAAASFQDSPRSSYRSNRSNQTLL